MLKLSHFSQLCDRRNLREEGFIWEHGLGRLQYTVVEGAWGGGSYMHHGVAGGQDC